MPQVTEDMIWGMDEMLEWQEVWLGAVALAWRDPDFRAELLADARRAIAVHFEYNLPPHLDLTVKEVPKTGKWGWRTDGEDGWVLPSAMLTVTLPPPPAKLEDQVVALADYSAAGRTYPFTTF